MRITARAPKARYAPYVVPDPISRARYLGGSGAVTHLLGLFLACQRPFRLNLHSSPYHPCLDETVSTPPPAGTALSAIIAVVFMLLRQPYPYIRVEYPVAIRHSPQRAPTSGNIVDCHFPCSAMISAMRLSTLGGTSLSLHVRTMTVGTL